MLLKQQNISNKTIPRTSVWIKTNHRNIEGIRSKGKKCNKKSSSIQHESVVKKERMNMVANIRCRQKFGYLTMQIIFADRRSRDPISDVSFHFYVYNVYSFHIFIRFPSPRSFCSVFKSRRTIPLSAGFIRREQFSCTLLFLIIISISIFLFISGSLFFNTSKS